MASAFPGGLDDFTNPTASDSLDSVTVPHATQHANVNDAIEAIETTLGVNPQSDFVTVSARIAGTEDALNTLADDVDGLTTDLGELTTEVGTLTTDLGTVTTDLETLNTALGDPTGSGLALVLSQISAEAGDELTAGTDPGDVDDSDFAGFVKFNVNGTDFALALYAIVPEPPVTP